MRFLLLTLTLLFAGGAFAQGVAIDKVIGVVGKYPILMSDLQSEMLRSEEDPTMTRCKIFEFLVYRKLLVAHADRDSLTVTDQEVETEMNRRMAHFIGQFGSEEKLEKYYGKRTQLIKEELRNDVREQMLADKMSSKITGDNKISPAEVKYYFSTIPEDSLPLINSEVELQQLVKRPSASTNAKEEAKIKLKEIREKIVNGKTTFRVQAALHSDDRESAKNGGLITNVSRGMMVPEFEAVAYRLKSGEISEIFESEFGYHIIELIQRKGEIIDLRHILIIPQVTTDDFLKSKHDLDSIYAKIRNGKLTFEEAVRLYSDDKNTKQNGGLMINMRNGSTKFDNEAISYMDNKLINVINNLKPGEMSQPMEYISEDGKPGFRILKLKSRIDPHRANLKDDYQRMSQLASSLRNQKAIKDWIKNSSKTVYIHLDPEFSCKFEGDWTISN